MTAASRRLAGLALAVCLCAPAVAHNFATTEVLVVLKSDGTWQADVTIDVDALALGVSQTAPSEEVVAALESMTVAEFEASVERARDTMMRRTRVRIDGEKQRPEVTFPELGSELAERWNEPTVLGATARLSGRLPEGARELSFGASRSFNAVHLTILDQRSLTGSRQLLQPGENGAPFPIGVGTGDAPGSVRTGRSSLGEFLVLGFEHILPLGLDHILFVLGLFLLSTKPRPLLLQITAFTIAHSVTLGLSMYGLVSLPAQLVEVLIALSIVYVAVENLFTSDLRWWRPLLVFGFGLLHGMGFAGVLRELNLPDNEFVPALIGFNVGVELGQLTVVGLAFLAVGWFRDRNWYRPLIVWPASVVIACTGLWWALQRAIG